MKTISLTIDGEQVNVLAGSSVATAVFQSGADHFRRSVHGEERSPLCGMGVCFECRVTINDLKHQRSCQILAAEGMVIETDE